MTSKSILIGICAGVTLTAGFALSPTTAIAANTTSARHYVSPLAQPARNRGYAVPTTGQSPYNSGQSNPYNGGTPGTGPSIPQTDHQQNRTRQIDRVRAQ